MCKYFVKIQNRSYETTAFMLVILERLLLMRNNKLAPPAQYGEQTLTE